MSERAQRMTQSLWEWGTEVLHSSSKSITALMIVGTFLFVVGGWVWDNLIADHVTEEVRNLNGTPEIVEAIESVSVEQRALSVQVDRLGRQVDAITPDPVIVEYDELRTLAPQPCFRGEVCEVIIRSKRTRPFGETCGTPRVLNRTFVDALGIVSHPRRLETSEPRRRSGDWSSDPIDFVVPRGANFGVGEYWITLEYPDCQLVDIDGNVQRFGPIRHETFPARVEVQPKQE